MKENRTNRIPDRNIDYVEGGNAPREGRVGFDIASQLHFSTHALETYAFARMETVVYDAMVVAAALEFADRTVKRPALGWPRRFVLRIPVHEPDRWSATSVSESLLDAVRFLTGDYWEIEFVKRLSVAPAKAQDTLELSMPAKAVIAYSDGMDSRAVGGILHSQFGNEVVLVRLGKKGPGRSGSKRDTLPFTGIPYKISAQGSIRESSARIRGFKFALISAIAAYLVHAPEVILPESGQGSIGPVLVTVAHAYPDYRNHPLFTSRMERFILALFGEAIKYKFPRIWATKAETLREYVALNGATDWQATKSCWRNQQWCSINGSLRQCGVCAACMLRRMSVRAAGLSESRDGYVCMDPGAKTLRAATHPDFKHWNKAFEEYALAGVLHLDHLADLVATSLSTVERHAVLIAPSLGITADEAKTKLVDMLSRHTLEWTNYLNGLATNSYIRNWTRSRQ